MFLPRFEHIIIDRLSLYRGKISHPIVPGVNMVIGGNGVGKTTFVNTLLFALVGNAEYEVQNVAGRSQRIPVVSPDFFQGRVLPEDEKDASVTLKFTLADDEIEISRSLFRPSILGLKINGKQSVGSKDKEEVYRAYLKK